MAVDTVIGARRTLGDKLRILREGAGLTQGSLARMIGYSRSTLAGAEGGQGAGRGFWEACDQALGCGEALTTDYDAMEELRKQIQEEAARAAHQQRRAQAQSLTAGASTAAPALTEMPLTEEQSRGHIARTVADALRQTLTGYPAGTADGVDSDDLEERVLDSYNKHGQGSEKLSLTLVGGFAGSGKSEFARFLSSVTGWGIIDKDTVTRALVEELLCAYGAEPNDRHSELYLTKVRPHEYRGILDQAMETLGAGASVIVTMSSSRAWTLVWTPRRMSLSVSRANQRSTWLIQEDPVGVKCMWKRGWRASHALISGVLWVP